MYKVEPLELLFKDKSHENEFFYWMDVLGQPLSDREYGSLIYLITATGNGHYMGDVIDTEGIDITRLKRKNSTLFNFRKSHD